MQPAQISRRLDGATLSREALLEHQKNFVRLMRRYKQLTWASSAKEQQERTALQQPLLDLHRLIHPNSGLDDDIDVVIRMEKGR
jgi:hypothetical protein